jgi:metal-responsive CopG/Arc/MetJ family transcriptional regulator
MSKARPYVNIPIPDDLIKKIEKTMSSSSLGYRSRAELVVEAVREKIREIEKESKK